MSMLAAKHRWMNAEELLHLRGPEARRELVRGELIVREPAGFRHGDIAARLLIAVGTFVESRSLGRVFTAETGFRLRTNPDTVRAPDVAFVRRDRLPDPPPRGYAAIPPDLVIEVLSPEDRPGDVLSKLGDWLQAGTSLAWVVDPERRTARVYRADGSQALITDADRLDGEAVLPEFQYELRRAFE
jgi:Uma2 family endonuclease